MVGSIAQYRDRAPLPEKKPEKEGSVLHGKNVTGNRPHSKTVDTDNAGKTAAPRHHFVEPPKRGFYHFD